jgi:hypothetical protein
MSYCSGLVRGVKGEFVCVCVCVCADDVRVGMSMVLLGRVLELALNH